MAYRTRKEAEEDARRMEGWDNVRVIVEKEPAIDGSPIIYILATDPITLRRVYFEGPEQQTPRTYGLA